MSVETVTQSGARTGKMPYLKWPPVLLVCLLAIATAQALNPARHIAQYGHSKWTVQDGVFNGIPSAFAQTTDGYLWIGTYSGLVRFDGVRFVRLPALNDKLPSSTIITLAAARDGSLWIGTDHGVSHWANHELSSPRGVPAWVFSILEDRDGRIWFNSTDADNHSAGLCVVLGQGTRCYTEADGVLLRDPLVLEQDVDGSLWSGDVTGVAKWNSGTFTAFNIKGLKNGIDGVRAIVPTPNGAMWVGISLAGPGLGLQQLDQGKWKPFITSDFVSSTLAVTSLLLDREGALWVGTQGKGLYRIYGREVENFRSADGLSSDAILKIFEDHEGNIWVATTRGVDFFHDQHVTTFPGTEGPSEDEADGVLASRDGTVWVARPTSLDAFREGKLFSIKTGDGLPGQQVTSLLEDHSGRLWVGIDTTLSVYQHGEFRPIKKKDGHPLGVIVGLTEDVEQNVWAEVIGPPRTLFRIRDFQIQDEFPVPRMPAARKIAADPQGGIWLGLVEGSLARYRNGRLQVFSYAQNGATAEIRQLTVNLDGTVLGATARGVIAWRKGIKQTLTVRNGLPCDNVFSHVLDNNGSLWLNTACGLVDIPSSELEKWWREPTAKLQANILDVFDGARAGDAPFNGAARASDGRLWFANWLSLQMIDPSERGMNGVVPPVQVEELVADRKSYSTRERVSLPPLTRDVEITYTGLSFVIPQKVRFRYKLEGRDTDWQEPGTRRQAFYSGLRPGTYTFRVVACNNDGLWNEQGAALIFSVAPAWFQTKSFLLICLVTGTTVLWALYLFRVQKIEQSFHARFDERLAERIRVAREFHDTLLQTIQGSKMVADDAIDASADLPRMRAALQRLSSWLGQAMEESRAGLISLRASTTQTNDLAESFRRAVDDCRMQGFPEAIFVAEGKTADMHPIVRDEIYRIGYEAIRNACRHSGANRLDVRLSYSEDLALRVSDNGRGIDAKTATLGKDGHYGLQGMRERALRISGQLTVDSSLDSGTTIKLFVPGSIVFKNPVSSWSSLFRRINSHLRSPREKF